jgi:hypothetical protein
MHEGAHTPRLRVRMGKDGGICLRVPVRLRAQMELLSITIQKCANR